MHNWETELLLYLTLINLNLNSHVWLEANLVGNSVLDHEDGKQS